MTIRQILAGIWYSGNRFTCPICNRSYARFLPYGDPVRPHALCPGCHSLERHRLLFLLLTRLWDDGILRQRGLLLYIAPEPSLQPLFKERFTCITADIVPGRAMQEMDITKIPYPDSTFDAVVCHHVLEHIPDDAMALSELYRVLKQDGWASIQVPLAGETTLEDMTGLTPEIRKVRFGNVDHVRSYGRDFFDRLRQAGFRVESYSKADYVPSASLSELSVECENEMLICRKS